MALKTNSKKAIENIRKYIVDNFTPEGYTDKEFTSFPEISRFILDTFRSEYRWQIERCGIQMKAFREWASGLPGVLDTCYYYNRSAVKDLGDILEETEEERNRFTEAQAEEMLTNLIYRELHKMEA